MDVWLQSQRGLLVIRLNLCRVKTVKINVVLCIKQHLWLKFHLKRKKKKKKTQKDVKELTSVCPGRIAFSDNETPFPLFSSAEEPIKGFM